MPIPNQSHAFFASGGSWVDPSAGELEQIYNRGRHHSNLVDPESKLQMNVMQGYTEGKSSLDRTNMMLKRL